MIREIVNTGIIFYAMAVLTAVGVVSRIIYYRLYRRFSSESEKIAESQNRLIRQIRMKYENAFRVNNGVNNPAALVDKYVYGYRFMGIKLRRWSRLGLHMVVLTVLLGAAGAGLTLLLDLPEEQLIWYGVMGGGSLLLIGAAAFMTNIHYHEQVMYTNIYDYLENTLSCRLKNECDAEAEVKAERRRQQAKQRLEAEEVEAAGTVVAEAGTIPEQDESLLQVAAAEVPKKSKRRFRKKDRGKEEEIEQMKKNLDQIAADTTERHDPPRSLTKAEQQAIVEDILKEYLS